MYKYNFISMYNLFFLLCIENVFSVCEATVLLLRLSQVNSDFGYLWPQRCVSTIKVCAEWLFLNKHHK